MLRDRVKTTNFNRRLPKKQKFASLCPVILVVREQIYWSSRHQTGAGVDGVDSVRKLTVDVATTGSTLMTAQAVLARAVRQAVGNDPYKMRAVRVARMTYKVAKAAYASARDNTDRSTVKYDETVITFPG